MERSITDYIYEQNENTKKWKYKLFEHYLYGDVSSYTKDKLDNSCKILVETDFIFDTEDIAKKKATEHFNNTLKYWKK